MSYFTVDEHGDMKEIEEITNDLSWDCWPTVYKVELYAGPDFSIFKMVKDGWEEVK